MLSFPSWIDDDFTCMQVELHLLIAVGLYMISPVLPTLYQYGTPTKILPLPLGSRVVFGLNVKIREFLPEVSPSMSEEDRTYTASPGRLPSKMSIP